MTSWWVTSFHDHLSSSILAFIRTRAVSRFPNWISTRRFLTGTSFAPDIKWIFFFHFPGTWIASMSSLARKNWVRRHTRLAITTINGMLGARGECNVTQFTKLCLSFVSASLSSKRHTARTRDFLVVVDNTQAWLHQGQALGSIWIVQVYRATLSASGERETTWDGKVKSCSWKKI